MSGYRTVIVKLIRCGYDIYLPIDHDHNDLVIWDGNQLLRCTLRSVSLAKAGPVVNLHTGPALIDHRTCDAVLAYEHLSGNVWLIPLTIVLGKTGLRLTNRDDLLLTPLYRDDLPLVYPGSTAKLAKRQMALESSLSAAAEAEQQYYSRMLSGRDVE